METRRIDNFLHDLAYGAKLRAETARTSRQGTEYELERCRAELLAIAAKIEGALAVIHPDDAMRYVPAEKADIERAAPQTIARLA